MLAVLTLALYTGRAGFTSNDLLLTLTVEVQSDYSPEHIWSQPPTPVMELLLVNYVSRTTVRAEV